MDTLLLTFLVKEKSVPVWAARAHKTKSLMKASVEEETENLIEPSIIYKTTKILKEVFLCPHKKL